jgi:late competence protein required for DNA uptake (superfamily II DNA/RNA helicase)
MPRHLNSFISVRTYDTSEPLVGRIQDSRKPRVTEIEALTRIAFGDPIPATDTIGKARREGKCQCKRCLQYKDLSEFGKYKKGEAEYSRPYCKTCRVAMERTRRFSQVEPLALYPKRIE